MLCLLMLLYKAHLNLTPFSSLIGQAQTIDTSDWYLQPGVIGTIVLCAIVLVVFALISAVRISKLMGVAEKARERKSMVLEDKTVGSQDIGKPVGVLSEEDRIKATADQGVEGFVDRITTSPGNPIVEEKKMGKLRFQTDGQLINLVLAYIGSATIWLVFGTLVGQYLGMKFVWPEMDQVSWLSFGRLRPVHTNSVFWGWASLAMIGLGYFVISRTSNIRMYSYKLGWIGLALINATVLLGTVALAMGINNGGGEYREYIWPIMLPFAVALILTLVNFYKTIAHRKAEEIYISNWFILGALVWTIVLVIIAYLPFYQKGLGETIIQGYYMHQGVGMWFMTFTLGLVYYYLPSALNKPIYSYSLGVLAFWTQMLFYTMIGTHHFIFAPLPWWLQTVAIVFSGGMFIPVLAGTINFLMTMKGSWKTISDSYVLPFMLVGVIFYFVGSTQGSFQAFRYTNFIWHFTDFNVAHSHMTMYGIICFLLWGSIYAIVPKLTRSEPNQLLVGMHFWFAFIGLTLYMFSLMIGGSLKGAGWIDGVPFMETVNLMAPYWVWRAVGGSLMFLSHLFFGWNLIQMIRNHVKLTKRDAMAARNIELKKSEIGEKHVQLS